ncbi:hypothetical protein [Actinomadura nitritigenes]|uniref:hypothetical protein n=1 Tax=Actinomadura nitritigenes TaxID=134602 RepID=UPI003D8E6F71
MVANTTKVAAGRDRRPPKCPDCTARGDSATLTLTHDDGCPVGRGQDETSAGDREFFETHPNAPHMVRPLGWAEGIALKTLGAVPPHTDLTGWRVMVRQLAPGVRTRRYFPPRGGA